jgi:hypothetical protein
MHVSYYDDGLRWLINDDGYIIVLMLIYFTVMIVYLNDDGYYGHLCRVSLPEY